MNEGKRFEPYYVKYGEGCAGLLRCTDCQQLVTRPRLHQLGCCECGCKRVKEVRTLQDEEYQQIASGAIDFPHRDEFLKEFTCVE